MAFIMPIVKKDYTLYSKQQRALSETDGGGGGNNNAGRKGSAVSNPPRPRRVRSEGPSLSTSPMIPGGGSEAMEQAMAKRSKSVQMRRVRGSAPVLVARAASLSSSYNPGTNTAPTGNSPAPKFSIVSSPSRSTSSSSSSSGSTTNLGRFHTKLVARIRRTLRLRDPEPTTS